MQFMLQLWRALEKWQGLDEGTYQAGGPLQNYNTIMNILDKIIELQKA